MEPTVSLRHRWAALSLIAGVTILRLLYLAYLCPLDLASDEAYYWDWSRHLDWSYHSKGPLVAWLIRLSCELFGDTMFAVRLPAVVCGSLLLVGLYVLTVQVYQSDKLGLAVVALALTLPMVAVGSMLMTIDAPFTCAWMWALVFGYRAVFRLERRAWYAAGVCVMLGLLAKHTMVLWVPSFALFLLTTPAQRVTLRDRVFWIMAGIGALGAAPIVVWNVLHGWVTLEHTQTHAGFDGAATIRWLGPLQYVGAQFAVLLGFWFVVWAQAMWEHRPTRDTQPELRFLWWMSAPMFVFFGLFAIKNGGGEANWPAACYLSGMVLVAGWHWRKFAAAPQATELSSLRLYKFGILGAAAVGLLVTIMMHEPIRVQPVFLSLAGPASKEHPMPIRRVDPTTRLRGWRHLGSEVDAVRAKLKARGIEPVLAAERWTQAGELGFYCEGQPAIFCLGPPLGDRVSQYDLWRPNPVADIEKYHGRTFLIVGLGLHRLRPAFEGFESAQVIRYHEEDCLIAEWEVVVAHGFHGWGAPNFMTYSATK